MKMKIPKYGEWTYREIVNGFLVVESLPMESRKVYFVDNELDAINMIVKSTQQQHEKVLGERYAHFQNIDPTNDDSVFDPRREI